MSDAKAIDPTWTDLVISQKSKTDNLTKNKDAIDSYYFIFDCFDNEIEYVNSTFQIITDYERAEFTIEKLLQIIHPDDSAYFIQCEGKGLKLTNTLSFNEHFRYLMSYSYRIRIKNENYIWVRQLCQAIEVNEGGHLTKTLVKHLRINGDYERPANDYRVFDKNKNIYLDTENIFNLTKREQEILDLIYEGFSSTEIAEKLFKSKFTIDTHRKNILNKTNAKNFQELILRMRVLE
ncbi:LuxR C-terminal-related transcriptional regulator [Rhinopithecimicrobium faecis]